MNNSAQKGQPKTESLRGLEVSSRSKGECLPGPAQKKKIRFHVYSPRQADLHEVILKKQASHRATKGIFKFMDLPEKP